jgi:hypothetical protein
MRLVYLLIALGLAGCVGPRGPTHSYYIESETIIQRPVDDTWEQLIDWLADQPLQIKGLERESGVLYAEGLLAPELGWADCGGSGSWYPLDLLATLNVFVRPTPEGARVTVDARFARLYGSGGDRRLVQCVSTGRLEAATLAALR